MGDKDSTLQCYSNITYEKVFTSYPNGSTFGVDSGDFAFGLGSNDTVAEGVPLSSLVYTIFKEEALNSGSTTMIMGTLSKQRVISLICVKSFVVEELQLQLRLPHLQLQKLLAVDKWLL